LKGLPTPSSEEWSEVLAEGKNTRIERIISHGQATPPGFWYDQDQAEWVMVLEGEAFLRIEGLTEPLRLQAGDQHFIPAHQKHRVEWTTPNGPTVWLAVFFEEGVAMEQRASSMGASPGV
jgi:cupin 2 domain-containing protein